MSERLNCKTKQMLDILGGSVGRCSCTCVKPSCEEALFANLWPAWSELWCPRLWWKHARTFENWQRIQHSTGIVSKICTGPAIELPGSISLLLLRNLVPYRPALPAAPNHETCQRPSKSSWTASAPKWPADPASKISWEASGDLMMLRDNAKQLSWIPDSGHIGKPRRAKG